MRRLDCRWWSFSDGLPETPLQFFQTVGVRTPRCNTPTLTTDEYVLGLLVSIEMDWITTYDFPSNDIAERMKNEDASKLKSVLKCGK